MVPRHYTAGGTLIDTLDIAPELQEEGRDRDEDPPDDPGNPTVDFHGRKPSNETCDSTIDPDPKLRAQGKR